MRRTDLAPAGLRVLMYSHDTMGLGHTRRNQSIARCLDQAFPDPSILMVTGARESTFFDVPDCVDFVTLPAVKKHKGSYVARHSCLTTEQVIALRSELLLSVAEYFDPDVLIVDKVPGGVQGELIPTLKHLRACGRTRCILGLRDILDSPDRVKSEWLKHGYDEQIERYFDAVWVYGDARICDHANEYIYGTETSRRLRYLGYINPLRFAKLAPLPFPTDGRSVIACVVGGGEDGGAVARTFAQSVLPADSLGVIVVGPFMPVGVRKQIEQLASDRNDLRVVDFLRSPQTLLQKADVVVSMCGYNTTCELLALNKPAIIVPRTEPRKEQLIRAERMSRLGLFQMIRPESFVPEMLSECLQRGVPQPTQAAQVLDFDGLARLPIDLHRLLTCHGTRRPAFSIRSQLFQEQPA